MNVYIPRTPRRPVAEVVLDYIVMLAALGCALASAGGVALAAALLLGN